MMRILTSVVGGGVFIAMTWFGGWAFVGLMAVIALAGQKEAFNLFSTPEQQTGNLMAFLAGMAIIFTPAWPPAVWFLAPLAIGSLAWFLLRAPGGQPLATLGGSLFGLFYPCLFLASLVAIRLPHREVLWDPFVVTMGLVLLMWTADSAAYYSGRTFGRRKLAPTLSPGKTWEGAISGGIAALVAAAVFSEIWSGGLPLIHWLALAGLVGVLGPLGDLFESALKRAAGTKDSASILPGHGGLLDRFDALIFVAPVAAAYLFGLV
ncbi:MAG: phosphatidate cytidylyltransferase [Rhodothermales bacterium]|jgi:phosphatidate cytidylyltransferase